MYHTRKDWNARPPKQVVPMGPAKGVIVHHSVTPLLADPRRTVQEIQRQHQDVQGWFDIAYQELVDVRGDVWEGRGFRVQSGATGQPWDKTHLTICALGNFETFIPPAALVQSLVARIVAAARDGLLSPGFTITGHRDHKSTACPGKFLHDLLPDVRLRVSEALTPPPPGDDVPEIIYYLKAKPAGAASYYAAWPSGVVKPIQGGGTVPFLRAHGAKEIEVADESVARDIVAWAS